MKKIEISKRSGIVITGVVILSAISLFFLSTYNIKPLSLPLISTSKKFDKFGIMEIYPTKAGGREWFINMENPTSDGIFNPQSNLSRQQDGSWRITGKLTTGKFYDEVRMNVNTPTGAKNWKNVEITGYAKVDSIVVPFNGTANDDLTWYARGGKHNPHMPCEGTAYMGGIYADGHVGWKKEIWFTGGYTTERAHAKVTDSLIGRWVGWKAIIYNTQNDTAVKLESYLDSTGTNDWIKVADVVDNGGWLAKTSDSLFYSAKCDKPKDYIITSGGPIATFRSDDLVWDFKNLSVREIQPSKDVHNGYDSFRNV
ncbi:MAG: hypothetical protein WBP88_11745 [Nitrososphaeraceae archaeon]